MNGTKRKSKKTVEQLKNESEYLAVQEQLEKERKEIAYQKWDLDDRETHLKVLESILQDKLKKIAEYEEKSLKLASEASKMYKEAQEFYLQEQAWMGTQQKQHIKERYLKAERHKDILRKIPTEFMEMESSDTLQQQTDVSHTF